MLAPFTQDELALLGRDDFLEQASAAGADLVAELAKAKAAGGVQLAVNSLGNCNRQLVDALERFIAASSSKRDAQTARELASKIRAALQMREQP